MSDEEESNTSETITLRFGNFSITKNTTSDQMTLVWSMGVTIQVRGGTFTLLSEKVNKVK